MANVGLLELVMTYHVNLRQAEVQFCCLEAGTGIKGQYIDCSLHHVYIFRLNAKMCQHF